MVQDYGDELLAHVVMEDPSHVVRPLDRIRFDQAQQHRLGIFFLRKHRQGIGGWKPLPLEQGFGVVEKPIAVLRCGENRVLESLFFHRV